MNEDAELLYARQGYREGEVKPAQTWCLVFGSIGTGDWVAVLRLGGDIKKAERHAFKHDAERAVMDWVQLGKR